MTTSTTYNGWASYETWNAALWIQNEEPLYSIACDYVQRHGANSTWLGLLLDGDLPESTPDGVALNDPKVDFSELDVMLRELLA